MSSALQGGARVLEKQAASPVQGATRGSRRSRREGGTGGEESVRSCSVRGELWREAAGGPQQNHSTPPGKKRDLEGPGDSPVPTTSRETHSLATARADEDRGL